MMFFWQDPEFGDRMITLMAAFVLVLQITMVAQRWLITNIRAFAIQSAVIQKLAVNDIALEVEQVRTEPTPKTLPDGRAGMHVRAARGRARGYRRAARAAAEFRCGRR